MPIPSDYSELLSILNTARAKYLIVGAYAVTHYTEPRYTKDLDIWVEASPANARKIYQALKKFGAPLEKITPEDFTNQKLIYQIGVAPVRVDIIMGLPGLPFRKAWSNRTVASWEGIQVNILGLNDLIKLKEKAKRTVNGNDLADLRRVSRLTPARRMAARQVKNKRTGRK